MNYSCNQINSNIKHEFHLYMTATITQNKFSSLVTLTKIEANTYLTNNFGIENGVNCQ